MIINGRGLLVLASLPMLYIYQLLFDISRSGVKRLFFYVGFLDYSDSLPSYIMQSSPKDRERPTEDRGTVKTGGRFFEDRGTVPMSFR